MNMYRNSLNTLYMYMSFNLACRFIFLRIILHFFFNLTFGKLNEHVIQ